MVADIIPRVHEAIKCAPAGWPTSGVFETIVAVPKSGFADELNAALNDYFSTIYKGLTIVAHPTGYMTLRVVPPYIST